MKLGLLKNVIGAVAPTLGTALGGPMGGMAANMIAEVLGVPNNPKAIEKGLAEATPEQMLELKKAEQDFDLKMKIKIYLKKKLNKSQKKKVNK